MLDEVDGKVFDAVVIGTGFVQSLIAGGLARAKKSVLHVDSNGHYGAETATLSFSQFQEFIAASLAAGSAESNTPTNGSPSEPFFPSATELRVSSSSYFEKNPALLRHFCVDLCPRPVFSFGPLLEVLVGSGITSYVDFKIIQRAFVAYEGGVHAVPSSKADVFKSNFGPLEKRRLGMFLQLCLPPNFLTPGQSGVPQRKRRAGGSDTPTLSPELSAALAENRGQSFEEFLESRKLSKTLRSMIAYGIAGMKSVSECENTSAKHGVNEMMNYVMAVGKYGPSPYIYPMYGVSEFVQAFCRYAAVNGALYMLRQSVVDIATDESTRRIKAVTLSGGERVYAHHVVSDIQQLPTTWQKGTQVGQERVRRAIFVTDRPIEVPMGELSAEEEAGLGITDMCLTMAPGCSNNVAAVSVLQLSHGMRVCPEGHYLVHLTAPYTETAKTDIDATAAFLFENYGQAMPQREETSLKEGDDGKQEGDGDDQEKEKEIEAEVKSAREEKNVGKPQVLWRCDFVLAAPFYAGHDHPADNLHMVSGVVSSTWQRGYDLGVSEAINVFHKICGKYAEFMPDNSLREYENVEWGWWDGEGEGRWWRLGDQQYFG